MIKTLKPEIIGHFDLIRLFDNDYKQRLEEKTIKAKILRNLELIKKHNLIVELNVASLRKGEKEPYPSKSIRDIIKKHNIKMLCADDSHGIDSVGAKIYEGMEILRDL